MAHRIFLALPISTRTQNEVHEWAKQYRNLPVRWLEGKNLHVTIVPPWEEEDVDAVRELLKPLERSIGPFRSSFERVRFGPNANESRLIWAEGESPDQLFLLKHNAERALMRTPETKPFRLHATLARFRPEEFAKFPVKKLDDRVAWKEEFSSFVLMESHLASQGVDYEVLETFPL